MKKPKPRCAHKRTHYNLYRGYLKCRDCKKIRTLVSAGWSRWRVESRRPI